MMSWFKSWLKSWFAPKRSGLSSSGRGAFVDLDALILDPVEFHWRGKIHVIRPITTETFFKYTNSLAHLQALGEKKETGADELVDGYFGLISSVCDTITRRDIDGMTQAQIGALWQLVIDSVTGKAQALIKAQEQGEKKNLKIIPRSTIST